DGREARRLRRLRVRLCFEVQMEVTLLGGPPERVVLEREGEQFVYEDDLYLVVHEAPRLSAPPFWQTIAGLIAEALRVPTAADAFVPILLCESAEDRGATLRLALGGSADEAL